jgi:hypothetical protein
MESTIFEVTDIVLSRINKHWLFGSITKIDKDKSLAWVIFPSAPKGFSDKAMAVHFDNLILADSLTREQKDAILKRR